MVRILAYILLTLFLATGYSCRLTYENVHGDDRTFDPHRRSSMVHLGKDKRRKKMMKRKFYVLNPNKRRRGDYTNGY